MTVKQIAETCGVDERTVRRWVKKASDKMPSLLDKLSDAERTKMASEYNLDETIAAIEQGMGKNAAAVFRMSAKQPTENLYPTLTQNATDRIDRLEAMVEKLCLAVATIPQTIQAMTRQPLQIDFVQEYYSLKAWARRSGFSLTYSEAVNYGRKAVKLSKLGGVEIRDIDDERYGKVHSYHTSVLKKVFEVNHG